MLEIVSSDFLKATNYLIDNYPTDKRLIVHVMEGYDTIETPTGKGFGVFIPETLEIYIAGDMPGESENLIKTLAHEFKHFLQYCDGKPFNETEAEKFAEEIYKKAISTENTPQEIFRKAVQTWGKVAQVDMMIEEMEELTKALLNERRGRDNNIAEEMADVRIMLEQMAVVFQNGGEVERIFREKVTRLDQRLNNRKGASADE